MREMVVNASRPLNHCTFVALRQLCNIAISKYTCSFSAKGPRRDLIESSVLVAAIIQQRHYVTVRVACNGMMKKKTKM